MMARSTMMIALVLGLLDTAGAQPWDMPNQRPRADTRMGERQQADWQPWGYAPTAVRKTTSYPTTKVVAPQGRAVAPERSGAAVPWGTPYPKTGPTAVPIYDQTNYRRAGGSTHFQPRTTKTFAPKSRSQLVWPGERPNGQSVSQPATTFGASMFDMPRPAKQSSATVDRASPSDKPSTPSKTTGNAPAEPSKIDLKDDWFTWRCSGWIWDVDLVGLRRRNADGLSLITDQATGGSVISSSDLDFTYKLGLQVGVTHHDASGFGWEIAYLGIPSWDGQAAAVGNLQLNGPGFDLAVNPAAYLVEYDSSLHSGEIHLRISDGCRWSCFGGFRYIAFNDDLLVSELNAPFKDALDIDAENNLYGVQFGGDALLYDRGGPLNFSVKLKFGVYGNHAQQRTYSSVLAPAVEVNDTKVAFVGEADFVLTYQLTERLLVHGGYRLMGLGGVALAPDQINASDLSTGQANIHYNSLLLDGGFLGIMFVR